MFRKKNSTTATWQEITQILRKLRGQNLLRARAEEFRNKNLLRFSFEDRKSQLQDQAIWLHVTATLQDCWAEIIPGQEKMEADSLEALLRAIAARLRQTDYIRTELKQATYRKPMKKADPG
ncbi:MAG: hypothetical protein AAFR61_09000 [Bacteroidota bacterium]